MSTHTEILTLEQLEDSWREVRGKLTQRKSWAQIVVRAQAQLNKGNDEYSLRLIDPRSIFEEMVLNDIQTYEELSADTFKKSRWEAVPIDGMPCIYGRPVWDRLSGEDVVMFKAFNRYLDMDERSLKQLSKYENVSLVVLDTIAQIWHWRIRAELYDAYEVLKFRRKQKRLTIKMHDRHRTAAERLFDKCSSYLEENIDSMTPKDALALMKEARKVERLAMGLESDSPGSTDSELNSGNGTSITINASARALSGGKGSRQNEIIDITPENKEEVSEELARVLTVMRKTGATKGNNPDASNEGDDEAC